LLNSDTGKTSRESHFQNGSSDGSEGNCWHFPFGHGQSTEVQLYTGKAENIVLVWT